jgi:hypothetical protein
VLFQTLFAVKIQNIDSVIEHEFYVAKESSQIYSTTILENTVLNQSKQDTLREIVINDYDFHTNHNHSENHPIENCDEEEEDEDKKEHLFLNKSMSLSIGIKISFSYNSQKINYYLEGLDRPPQLNS